MKMIDVLNMITEGKIKEGTKLILGDNLYIFNGDRFKAGNFYLGSRIFLNVRDLNKEVDLISPKPKKYLIKLNARGFKLDNSFVNYFSDGFNQYLILGNKVDFGNEKLGFYQTKFTEKEMQSIKPIKEFLEDMEGKYTLIEVEE